MRHTARLALIPFAVMALAAAPTDVAIQAAEVHEELCADAAGNDISSAGSSIARVSGTWVEVSEAYEESKDQSLLYWRGLLALCIGRDDLGSADLEAFVATSGDDKALVGQVKDAKKRLRRVSAKSAPASTGPDPGGIALGVGLAGGAAGLGGLSGWQNQVRLDLEARFESGGAQTAELDAIQSETGPAAARNSGLFLATASGLAVGAVTALIITAARGGPNAVAGAPVSPPIYAIAAPLPDGGFALTVGGAW